jgi:hypothetical protein
MGKPKTMIKQVGQVYQWPSWKLPEAFVWNAINSAGISYFQGFDYFL